MAKFHSLLDALNGGKGLSGTLGDRVYSSWNGIGYSRSKSVSRKDSNTPAQLVQRTKFSVILKFLKPLKEFISIGFRLKAKNMSAFNYATSYVYKNALVGEYPDVSIDYPSVILSSGKLAIAIEPQMALTAKREIEITWQVNPWEYNCYRNDKVMIIVYNVDKQEAQVVTNGNSRESMRQLILLPDTYVGDEVVCYLALQDFYGKHTSDSQFLGKIRVE